MKKILLCAICLCFLLSGCTEASVASSQIANNADAFRVSRKITVINTRSGDALYENQGLISVTISGDRLDILTKESDATYRKDIVKLNQDTMYIIEDLEGIKVEAKG